ncbi:MAG: J domain-containing protein [Polyangiales bacterium]
MTALSTAVCSITATQRGRYFWAVWWSAPPCHSPFQRPDVSGGGARTEAEAHDAATRAAGRQFSLTTPYWARAWKCVLRGAPPPPLPRAPTERPERQAPPESPWAVLGVEPGAAREVVTRAFRRRALETHPDRGGDPEAYIAVRTAYERLRLRR